MESIVDKFMKLSNGFRNHTSWIFFSINIKHLSDLGLVVRKEKMVSNFGEKEKGEEETNCASQSQVATMWNLPPEIITEILIRLPVKDILVCKSVFKHWYSLIDDSEFVKTHLKHTQDNQQAFFLMTRDSYSIVLDGFEGGPRDKVVKFALPIKHYDAGKPYFRSDGPNRCPLKKEIGCCNGLLCFMGSFGEDELILWNPSIREWIKIPNPRTQLDVVYRNPITWGFGCHPKTGEYKIVRIAPIIKKNKTLAQESEVKVFTVNSGLWRQLATIPFHIYLQPGIALVNGILHWNIERNRVPMILSFNIEDEKFKEIPQPVFKQGSARRITHLGVFEGCLSMLVDFVSIYEIWVMKDYNVKESWTKQFTIDIVKELRNGSIEDFTPLSLLDNGEILFRLGQKKPRLYSPKRKIEKDFWARSIHSNELHLAAIKNYVESLVSPKKILGTVNIEKATDASCIRNVKKRKR